MEDKFYSQLTRFWSNESKLKFKEALKELRVEAITKEKQR